MSFEVWLYAILGISVFFGAMYVYVGQDGKNRTRVSLDTFVEIGIVMTLMFAASVSSEAIGYCGDISWAEFFTLRKRHPIVCSASLVMAYALAAAIVALAVWKGITRVFKVFGK